MLRWLLIILFIYLVIRLIQGPRRKKRSSIRFHFGNFQNRGNAGPNQNQKPRLEEIEEAEYEDITEKSKKEAKE